MHKPIKYAEKGLSIAANGAWIVFNTLKLEGHVTVTLHVDDVLS